MCVVSQRVTSPCIIACVRVLYLVHCSCCERMPHPRCPSSPSTHKIALSHARPQPERASLEVETRAAPSPSKLLTIATPPRAKDNPLTTRHPSHNKRETDHPEAQEKDGNRPLGRGRCTRPKAPSAPCARQPGPP
eukprot:scaffold97649_cov29-Tisochrysis_lutea.AAC.5